MVTGEEHHEENGQETGDHEDWRNIAAGGKSVPVSKKSKKKKQHHHHQQQQQQQKEEKSKAETIEQVKNKTGIIKIYFFFRIQHLLILQLQQIFVHNLNQLNQIL
jgi:hypothetical protein